MERVYEQAGRIRQTREFPAPLGGATIECAGEYITGLWFEGQKYYGSGRKDFTEGTSPALDAAFAWLARYFGGGRPGLSGLRLAPEGTAFQLEVWRALCDIPYGALVTYGELAARLGRPGASRAVGAGGGQEPHISHNSLPSRRGADGSLTGYAGGIERKNLVTQARARRGGPKARRGQYTPCLNTVEKWVFHRI